MRELTKRENWRKYWRSSSSLSGKRKILGELERVEGGIGQEETAVKVLREQWRRERESWKEELKRKQRRGVLRETVKKKMSREEILKRRMV